MTNDDYTQETVDLPSQSRIANPSFSYMYVPAIDDRGRLRTAVFIQIQQPLGVAVDRFEIEVWKYGTSSRYAYEDSTPNRESTIILGDNWSSINIGIRTVNRAGMRSGKTTLTNQSVDITFDDGLVDANYIYGDASTAPTDQDWVDYFGRQPRAGDEITVIEKDINNVVVDSQVYVFESALNYYWNKEVTNPRVYIELQNEGKYELRFEVSDAYTMIDYLKDNG